jgi:hypothetical protein
MRIYGGVKEDLRDSEGRIHHINIVESESGRNLPSQPLAPSSTLYGTRQPGGSERVAPSLVLVSAPPVESLVPSACGGYVMDSIYHEATLEADIM